MRKVMWFCLVLSMSLWMGCSAHNNNAAVINQRITDPHVRIEDPDIQNWLKFDFINYVQRKDALIEFEAKFTNYSPYNKTLAYKVEWVDENGFTQKTLMSRWILAEVEGKRNLIIHGISPNMKTKNFVVVLQRPNYHDDLRQDSYRKRHSN